MSPPSSCLRRLAHAVVLPSRPYLHRTPRVIGPVQHPSTRPPTASRRGHRRLLAEFVHLILAGHVYLDAADTSQCPTLRYAAPAPRWPLAIHMGPFASSRCCSPSRLAVVAASGARAAAESSPVLFPAAPHASLLPQQTHR